MGINGKNFTFVDVETTGGSPLFHRVIEIGIIRLEHGEITQKFKSLINPGREIPEFITEFTGISEAMVKKAPSFQEIAEDILPMFEDSIFVAHNSSFDYRFLNSEFERSGYKFNLDTLCTVRLSRALYPNFKRHNLSALIDRFGFNCKNRHRAYDDAKVLWDFFKLLDKSFSESDLETVLQKTIKRIPTWVPGPKQPRPVSKNLPELVYAEDIF